MKINCKNIEYPRLKTHVKGKRMFLLCMENKKKQKKTVQKESCQDRRPMIRMKGH